MKQGIENTTITSSSFMKTGIGLAGFGIGMWFLWPFIVVLLLIGILFGAAAVNAIEVAYENVIVTPYVFIEKAIAPDKYTAQDTITAGISLLKAREFNAADNMGTHVNAKDYRLLLNYIDAGSIFESKYHLKVIDQETLELTNPGNDLCTYFEPATSNQNLMCQNDKLLVKFNRKDIQ